MVLTSLWAPAVLWVACPPTPTLHQWGAALSLCPFPPQPSLHLEGLQGPCLELVLRQGLAVPGLSRSLLCCLSAGQGGVVAAPDSHTHMGRDPAPGPLPSVPLPVACGARAVGSLPSASLFFLLMVGGACTFIPTPRLPPSERGRDPTAWGFSSVLSLPMWDQGLALGCVLGKADALLLRLCTWGLSSWHTQPLWERPGTASWLPSPGCLEWVLGAQSS